MVGCRLTLEFRDILTGQSGKLFSTVYSITRDLVMDLRNCAGQEIIAHISINYSTKEKKVHSVFSTAHI